MPEHRRVLAARHGDVHDPRRHLHAPLRLLQRQDRQADVERPARAGPGRAQRRPDGAQARGDHERRPRRPARLRRVRVRRRDPADPPPVAEMQGRGADARLPRRGDAAGQGDRRAARRLQPQRRGRAAPVPASRAAARRSSAPAGCCATPRRWRRRDNDQVRTDGRARRDASRRWSTRSARCASTTSRCSRSASTCARPRTTCRSSATGIPDEFKALEQAAYELGFEHVAAGPLVRSSYHADQHVPQDAARRRAARPGRTRRGAGHDPPAPHRDRSRASGHRGGPRSARPDAFAAARRRLARLRRWRRRGRRRRWRRWRRRGVGIYILFQILFRIAVLGHGLGALVLIALVIAVVHVHEDGPAGTRLLVGAPAQPDGPRAASTAQRQRRVELAAAEAAEDDPAFAPDVVKPAAARAVHPDPDGLGRRRPPAARRARRAGPAGRVGAAARRFQTARAGATGSSRSATPTVEYVGLDQRGAMTSDRVVVRIEAKLRDYVEDRNGKHIKRDGQLTRDRAPTRVLDARAGAATAGSWLSIEQGAEGAHALGDQIVATPWSDEQGMRDEALVEGAVADARPRATRSRRGRRPRTSRATRAPRRSTSASPTAGSRPTCSRSPPAAPSPRGPRRSTATTAALKAIAEPPRRAEQLLHPGDPSAATTGSSSAARGSSRSGSSRLDAAATPPTMAIEVDIERPALHRGPRHGGGARRQPVARDELHRALDARARRRRRSSRGGSSRAGAPLARAPRRRHERPSGIPRPQTRPKLSRRVIPIKDNIPTDRFPFVTVALIVATSSSYLLAIRHGGSFFSGPDTQEVIKYGAIPYSLTHPGAHCAEFAQQTLVGTGADRDLLQRPELPDGTVAHRQPDGTLPAWETVFTVDVHARARSSTSAATCCSCGSSATTSRTRWGRSSTSASTSLGGIAALALQVAVGPNSTAPTIGASGAIAAVLGGYIVLYPRARVLTLVFIILFVTVIELPAWVMLGIWFARAGGLRRGGPDQPDRAEAAASRTSPTSAGSRSALLTIRLLATKRKQVPPRHPGVLSACASSSSRSRWCSSRASGC